MPSEGLFPGSPPAMTAATDGDAWIAAMLEVERALALAEERAGVVPAGTATSVSEAASYFASRAALSDAAPALVRLAAQIGTRFGVVVSQKLVAQSVPLIGAAGGAAINYAFADHFQTIARGHFTVLRLERRYGARIIRAEYERMRTGA